MYLTSSRSVRVAFAAVVWVALAGPLPLIAQSPSPQSKLAGKWHLNRDQSTQPGAVQNHADGNDFMSDFQLGQLREISRAISTAATELTVVVSDADVTFAGGGMVQKYTTDGKKQPIQLGSAKVDAKTHWDKNQFKQEVTVGNTKLTRTWQLSDDGKQLITSAKLESPSSGPVDPVKFIYDRE